LAETLKTETVRRKIWGLHPNVFFLGIVSLLTDVSSEMIFTLVPLFLSNILGASTTIIGLVGGLSDSTEGVFKIFSGWFSDRINKPKFLSTLGYGVSTLVKPFMLLATSWGIVTGIRLGDRVGKGIRTAPRDALVADSVSYAQRGRAFGLHRAMDTSGAVLGLVLAAVIIYAVQGVGINMTLRSYHWMILGGIIPAVIAILVLVIFVRERQKKEAASGNAGRFSLSALRAGFDSRFAIFLTIMGIFTLGNSSDFFIILRAQNIDAPLIQVVLMLVLFNVVYATTSLPMGILSDKLGRRRVIATGWFIYALVYLGFALASQIWQAWLLFAVYGLYYGMVEGVARAFVADLVPADRRGTAYGLYHGVVSIALLPASVIAGWLWASINPSATFYFGGGLAFVAALCILTLVKEKAATR
jgi:MFS family permease